MIRPIFEEAEAISGQPLREISVDGSAACLRNCAVLEPLLVAFSLSYIALLRLKGIRPHCVAGYSAGETAALYCSEVISRENALHIAAVRGRILHEAARQMPGKMVAIFGISEEIVQHMVLDAARDGSIEVAGYNAHDHLTIVGEESLVLRVEHQAQAHGASVFPLDVEGAWHSMRAKQASEEIKIYLDQIEFCPPSVAVYASATGNLEYYPERLRKGLAEQIYLPVLWQAAISNMVLQHGVHHFIEVGGGRTLKAITNRIAGSCNNSKFYFLNPYQETGA